MTLPLTCPACLHPASSHPATESGGFTCARYQGEPPSCRDCAAIITNLLDDCARVLADMMSPMAWAASIAPAFLPRPEYAPTMESFSPSSLPGALSFLAFDKAPARAALSPAWQERLRAESEAQQVSGFRGITLDPRLVIYDEWTATPGGHGIPQSAYTPTDRAAPWR